MARILVVEDESVAVWYLQEALEKLGHQVVGCAMSGEEALQEAKQTQPDLVLMDIRLQGEMDGIAAAQQINLCLDIPVVFLTAYADDSTLTRAIATNPYGYLVKPFQEREVHTTIEIALRRHRLDKRSEETKQWFVNTFDSIGDAAIATNRDGDIIYMNPAAESLTGWLQQEAVGQAATTVLKLIDARTRQEIHNPVIQAIQEDAPVSLPENTLLCTKDGVEIPIRDTATPIRNSNGETIGSVLVFQNDTCRQQALVEIQQRNRALELTQVNLIARLQERTVQLQQALASTQILKRVVAQVDEGVTHIQILQTIISELGRVLEADYCWVALYHDNHTIAIISCEYIAGDVHTNPSAIGVEVNMQNFPDFYKPLLQNLCWLFPPLELLPPSYKPFLTTDSQLLICPLINEEQVIGEVGIMSTHKSRWSGLQADILSQVVSQCAAVLNQAHSSQITHDSLRNLKLLNELKDDFISSVSRELCNPLTNIRIAVEMIERLIHSLHSADNQTATSPHRQSLWQKLEQYLQIVREEWKREFDLVSNLLNFQSLESLTEEALPFSPINLKQWLPEIINCFSEQAVRQGQILSCDISPQLSTIISHEPSLRRIIAELLTNACKHSPPDSWIALKADIQERSTVIQVTNTGVTIPPDQFHRIFEPFYQLTCHNLWNLSGTGLGLALVKKLVHLLGGDIQVSSQTGETTFIVTLYSNPK